MRSLKMLSCAVIVASSLLLSVSLASAQEYKIKLTRPEKVGTEYNIHVTTHEKTKMDATINGQNQSIKNDDFKVDLKGTLKVLAVNEKTGSATKVTVTVDSLTKDGTDLYPAGTVITAEKSNATKTDFTIDGTAVEAEKSEALDAVIEVQSDKRTSNDDELTGTDHAQKIGGTWPVNSEKLAKEMADSGAPVTAENLKGKSKLVEVRIENGLEVMEIHATVTADNIKKDNPDGSAITDGNLKVEVTSIAPTDNVSPGLRATIKMHLSMNIALPGGAGNATVVSDRDTQESREMKK